MNNYRRTAKAMRLHSFIYEGGSWRVRVEFSQMKLGRVLMTICRVKLLSFNSHGHDHVDMIVSAIVVHAKRRNEKLFTLLQFDHVSD